MQTNPHSPLIERQDEFQFATGIERSGFEMWAFRCGRLNLVSLPPDSLFAGNSSFLQISPVNAEVFVLAHENPEFGRLLQSTINVVDGRVLQWICKILYPGRSIVLLKGANFIQDLAGFCRVHGQRLFLLGSNGRSNAGAVTRLKNDYPGLQVSGYGPPLSESPFEGPCREQIISEIRRFRPHHVGVCFGPIKQEIWIQQNANILEDCGVRCAYAFGGTIDFLSSTRPRAPQWVQYIGAEWFFRFLCEPRARFYRTLIQFKMPFYAARTRRQISAMTLL